MKEERGNRFWGEGNGDEGIQCFKVRMDKKLLIALAKKVSAPLSWVVCVSSALSGPCSLLPSEATIHLAATCQMLGSQTWPQRSVMCRRLYFAMLFFALIVPYSPAPTTTQVCADVNNDWRWETNERNDNIKDRLQTVHEIKLSNSLKEKSNKKLTTYKETPVRAHPDS